MLPALTATQEADDEPRRIIPTGDLGAAVAVLIDGIQFWLGRPRSQTTDHARPLPRREQWARQMIEESLTPRSEIREQYRPKAVLPRVRRVVEQCRLSAASRARPSGARPSETVFRRTHLMENSSRARKRCVHCSLFIPQNQAATQKVANEQLLSAIHRRTMEMP
jgi:hypothetical protein